MKKEKSFVNEILIYLMIMAGLLLIVLGVFLLSSYSILKNEMKNSSDAFLKIYSNELTNDIDEMDGILKSITTQGEDLAKLKSSNENTRSLSAISLHNYMQNTISGIATADVIIVNDNDYNISLDAVNTGFSYKNKYSLRNFTSNAIHNADIHSFEWNFLKLDTETYLYKMLLANNRAIAIYIRASKLLNYLTTEDNGNRSIVLVNNKGFIGKIWGNETKDIKIGSNISNINFNNYYSIKRSLVNEQLTIYCFTSKNNIFKQTHSSMILVIIMFSVSVFFLFFILRYTREEITNPMRLMVSDMEKIKDGDYDNHVNANFKTNEFITLQNTINKMVREIIGLKIQTYEKRIELQEMELKSIRLQLKPHFFLNALSTISSLSSHNKNDQIKTYIDALSKNVRYMFRTGLHTVPIKDEIKHVENYFEMQELKYPGCIFYLIDLPQELEDWKIPQMLINTFIENEYKYAISMDHTLTILIKISKQTYHGEEDLLIEIQDDGKGYPKEVLDYMNGITENTSEKGTRIGLWSIKRMMELMYERNDLVILENIEPHGCLNRIYIPFYPVNELAEETIQRIL